MQITTERHDVSMSGMKSQRQFTVKAGAHIMAVLSGLYRDPIDAMVREYLTNMYDAYVALKRSNPDAKIIPPILHIPSALDPTLTFTDFGVGMSHDTVWQVYATYGESTKNNDNSEVGGFGLGSKTAFCYNGGTSWSIISRYNKEKHTFMAFIGEDGVPNLTHVSTVSTDEPNGVTVSIPIRREHMESVTTAARKYVPYFPMDLVVEGLTSRPTLQYIVRGKNWGIASDNTADQYSYRSAPRSSNSRVIMGNVPYKINMDKIDTVGVAPQHANMDGISHVLAYNSIDVYVPIGSVEIVPSRDDLKYTDRTISAIQSALRVVFKELASELNKMLASCDSAWDAMVKVREFKKITYLEKLMLTYSYKGMEISPQGIVRKLKDLQAHDASIEVTSYSVASDGYSSTSAITVTESPNEITADPLLQMLVWDDLDRGSVGVARGLAHDRLLSKTHRGRVAKYGHKTGAVYLIKTKLTREKLAELFGGMPVDHVMQSSVLRGTVSRKNTIKDTVYRWSGTSWTARANRPDTTDSVYYVPMVQSSTDRWGITTGGHTTQQRDALNALFDAWDRCFPKQPRPVLYGVKTDDVVDLPSNWIDFIATVRNGIIAAVDADPTNYKISMEYGAYTGYANPTRNESLQKILTLFANESIAHTKAFSEYVKWYNMYNNVINNSHTNLYKIVREVAQRTNDLDLLKMLENRVKSIKLVDLADLQKKLFETYPLIGLLHQWDAVRYDSDTFKRFSINGKKSVELLLDFMK